jgi:chromosome segregation ATPase
VTELSLENNHIRDENEINAGIKSRYDELALQYRDREEEVHELQQERDEVLKDHELLEVQKQALEAEAHSIIDNLEGDLARSELRVAELEQVLVRRNEELDGLRNEVRMMHEGLNKVEADVQARVRRIKELEVEVDELSLELENAEKGLLESNSKAEKLAVELESRQSECVFLREEQDGCMIKIGELEDSLKTAQASVVSESQRAKDLEARLADERRQR